MKAPSISQGLAEAERPPAIARLIRRICLLREQVNEDGAAKVEENEFACAVRDYRLVHGADALPESELRAMFATEESRVADALILSELLVPQLAGPLGASPDGPARAASPSPARTRPEAPVRRPPGGAGSPAIPDLLDAMLAAERAQHHPLSSAPRVS